MPKMKTNRSAKKRFKITKGGKSGKVRRYKAFKGHMRQTKTAKQKRGIRRPVICFEGDARVIREMLHG